MKLDIQARLQLNEILDGHAMVSSLRLDLPSERARAVVKFSPIAVPKMEQHCRILQFSDLRRVAIFTYGEKLPEELANIRTPSAKFMEFVSPLFDDRDFRQSDSCFGNPVPDGEPTWDYSLNPDLDEATCTAFCKVRGFEFAQSRAWALALWFGEIAVDRPMGDPCTVSEFIEEYSFLLRTD